MSKTNGGFKMRITTSLIASLFLLAACTGIDQKSTVDSTNTDEALIEKEQPEQVEVPEEVEEPLSKEEQLVQALPDEVSLEDWNLILVNPWESLPEDFDAEIVQVDNEQYIDERIEEFWADWKEAALNAGHRLFFASGHRNIELQRANFNNTYQSYLNEGLSEEKAMARTKEYLTEPGHSEHHTGLALDIVDEEWIVSGNGLEPEYDTQESQQWLVDTMADYGFILRYPEGKEEATGIQYESWHFRYVGKENAQFIIAHDLVLEEYIELLELREELIGISEEE